MVLLIALLVIGALVWLFVAQPWRGSAASSSDDAATPAASIGEPTPSSTPEAAPEDTPEAPAPPEGEGEQPEPELTPSAEACVPGSLVVEAVTDKAAYGPGENPQLSIRLTNQSESDCTLNVGTSAQAFEVSSGSDVWWRSTDCQTEPSDMIVLVKAGQQVMSATPVAWDRTRSSVESCAGDRPPAPSGGATYHLRVSIGGVTSANTAAFQLS